MLKRWYQWISKHSIGVMRALYIAEPVRHGLWLEDEDYMFCSCCGMQWNYCDNDTQDFKFCPHCGAKMDGGERNGQAD